MPCHDHKEHTDPKVKEYIELIQGLLNQTISFDKFHKDEMYIVSVDTDQFITNKFCEIPGTAWFYFQNDGAELMYEFNIALQH